MRRLLFILTVVIFTSGVLPAQKAVIRGELTESGGKLKIDYAAIAAYKTGDSTYVAGGVSDSSGFFSIEVPRGDYFLAISHINYKQCKYPVGFIQKDTVLVAIYLDPDKVALEEAVVRSTMPSVRMTNEKSIYKISDIPASSGGTLKDILKSIPLLAVDFNDDVLLNGMPAKFMIDGREITAGELAAYSPSQIATIEVINNPTSKYDALGLSGIIQLKAKRNYSSGISGSLNLSFAHDVQSGFTNLLYGRKKLKFSASFSLMNDYQHGGIETVSDGYSSMNKVKANVQSRTGNVSIDYNIDRQNLLYASYQYIDFGYVARDSSDKRTGKTDMRGITYQFATGYIRQFAGNGGKLCANLYYNETSPATQSWLNFGREPFYFSMNNYNNSYVGTLDYSLPFTENANFEAGLKTQTRNIDIWQENDLPAIGSDNKFSLRESIFAAYVLMNSRMGKFNVQFGLRSETNLADRGKGTRKWDFFPNLSLDYVLNENNTFKFGYNSRVNRPSAADINPFILRVDPTSHFQGNPDLSPEYSHNFFIDYMNEYQSNLIKISAYYRRVDDLITKIFINTDGTVLYSPVNLYRAHFYGLDFTAVQNFGQILSIQPSAGFSSVYIPRGVDKELRRVHSFNLGLTVGVKLPYAFNLQTMAKYSTAALSVGSSAQSAIVQGIATGLPQLLTEFAVSKSLLKGNMTLSVRATDPFRLQQNGFKVYSDNSLRETIYHMETRYIYLNISYRLNNSGISRRQYDDGGVHVF